jgi:hypothetical protein
MMEYNGVAWVPMAVLCLEPRCISKFKNIVFHDHFQDF